VVIKINGPKLSIENLFELEDQIYCLSKEKNKKTEIERDYCKDCNHYSDCIIWKNIEFEKFYQENRLCEKCKKNLLGRGYLLIIWKLMDLLPNNFKKECCFCFRRNNSNP